MLVKLNLRKTVEQNANDYFEKAKKARKKVVGLDRAMKNFKEKPEVKDTIIQKKRKMEWFEKFRWFFSSNGFLVIAGRDATTNEVIIKKYTDKEDWVFHTDMAGSPFTVIKTEGKDVPEQTMNEAAQFTASMSRAWKKGLGNLEVFYVRPEQVSKEAKAGESLGHGAFMIRGKTEYKNPEIALCACIHDEKFMVAPPSACTNGVTLKQAEAKVSDTAKKIKAKLQTSEDLDTIIRCLPASDVAIDN